MDALIRALERRVLDGTADDAHALLELERACERAGRDLPAAVLRRHPRWRTLVWFVNGWFRRGLDAESGLPGAELDAAEQRVGHAVPRALREAYLLLGARPDVRLRLAPPALWRLDAGLLLMDSDRVNRDEWPYGVRARDLGHPDPPVCSLIDESAPSVSSFVTGSTFAGALGLLRAHAERRTPVLRDDVRSAAVHGAARIGVLMAWLPVLPVPWLGTALSLRVHASDEVLLLAGRTQGVVSARTASSWREVHARLDPLAPG